MPIAWSIRVRGVIQGVGFRPFVYRLARAHAISGWVLNGEEGVEIHAEGETSALQAFHHALRSQAPPAANITELTAHTAALEGFRYFSIRESQRWDRPTVRIASDLPICDDCLKELFNPADPRFRYPYINCTNCGPRYSVVLSLPYDRARTTMHSWSMDSLCSREYRDPANRRFHAQPVACPNCGPGYHLQLGNERIAGDAAIDRSAALLRYGYIIAIKGIGGYHLACDARNATAVEALRQRKFRKEKPFALMACNLDTAASIVTLTPESRALLTSAARPIVLAPAIVKLTQVALENSELGVMLPYAPIHHLLFAAGAPALLVMTSANRSSEPIAYTETEAFERLTGIADAFLTGERPIARRVDDSVTRVGALGPAVLRRSRGYAPGAVVTLPTDCPILALGADLKNTITLVVDGQAFVSQHIGDLDHYEARRAFEETIHDLLKIYDVRLEDLTLIHDAHPQYVSTQYAQSLPVRVLRSVQHHRAHIASVLAEHAVWDKRVLGISFDGTGYGDDETVWGGEFFAGSLTSGFDRIAHLRPAALSGGDAAAQHPVQASAGFLAQLEDMPDFAAAPFQFPRRHLDALKLVRQNVRCFPTTSMGRLFDTAAALLGFTREITYEGQAAIWLEYIASRTASCEPYPFPFADGELDFRPLLEAIILDRLRGRPDGEIARAFQSGVAHALHDAATHLCRSFNLNTVVLSGGVFQNDLLLHDLNHLFRADSLTLWSNHAVPPNDGGISLGQAALAVCEARSKAGNQAARLESTSSTPAAKA